MHLPWDFWLIFAVLGVLIPWRGTARINWLLARSRVTAADRLALYASTIVFQWVLASVTAWRCYARGLTANDLGLTIRAPRVTTLASAAVLVFFGLLQYLGIRRLATNRDSYPARLRQIALRLMPRSSVEALVFVALAATAALCEEFLFRGFVLGVLSRATSSWVLAILASTALFAAAHLYQGRRGILATFLLGALLAISRVWSGSLLPPVAGHFLVDLMAGYLAPRYLERSSQAQAK